MYFKAISLAFFSSFLIASEAVAASGELCSSQNAKGCDTNQLCLYGTKVKNGKIAWVTQELLKPYAREARKRKLRCEVGSFARFDESMNNVFNQLKGTDSRPSSSKSTSGGQKASPQLKTSLCKYRFIEGKSRPDLLAIQTGLSKRNLYFGKIDAAFGSESCEAFKKWAECELGAQPIVSERAITKLMRNDPTDSELACYRVPKRYAAADTTMIPKKISSSSSCSQSRYQISLNQEVLQGLGLYASAIDGISGPNYRRAVTSGEKLLRQWRDGDENCLGTSEQNVLKAVGTAGKRGSSCKYLPGSNQIKYNFDFLRLNRLTDRSSINHEKTSGLIWMIDTASRLESRLSSLKYYDRAQWPTVIKAPTRDCRLDADELKTLAESGSQPEALAESIDTSRNSKPVKSASKIIDEPTCDDDPSICSVVQLCELASYVDNGVRRWSDNQRSTELRTVSLRRYVEIAKGAGLSCGVEKKTIIVAQTMTCANDPSKCSVIELCEQASGTNASGEYFWRMDASLQSYVDTAKSAGVSCGVKPKDIETVKASNCENNPTRCSIAELCQRATSFETGALGWTATISGAPYVQFAKNSGVTCGIRDDVVAAVPEQTQIEPLTPKKVLKYKNRKALVIGNASYVDQTPLKNPINDARAVAAKLQEIGFEVTYKEDLKVREFGRALGSFERTLSSSDISLIYYAGHGIEVDGENYLIPVDAELRNASDVKFETVMLQDAVSASLNTGKLSMVLIDACRDNPFAKSMKGKNRSIGRGLSVVDAQRSKVDQIISFAAESGEFAEDGNGDNSPYATALIDLLDEPNLEVGKLFRKLGDSVESMTKGKQIPVTRNRLSGEDIFFVVE